MKFSIFIAPLLFSGADPAEGWDLLAGFYVDTVNGATVKTGIALTGPYEYDPDRPHYYGGFHYMDVEYGLEGGKVSLGAGHHVGHGVDRLGVSYARLETQDLAGVEAVLSQMGLSLKLGYYAGLDGSDDAFLLGLGMGL